MTTIRRLRWDREALARVAGHRVTPDEIEEVGHGAPLALRGGPDRLVLIGATAGDRDLTVVLAPQTADVYEVVTARPASRRERRLDPAAVERRRDADRPRRIPEFAHRAEEAAWWNGHEAVDYLDELRPVVVRFATDLSTGRTIPLAPDDAIAPRSRADARGRTATNLVRQWIEERLDRLREAEPPRKRRR